ncbi:MAG: diaminopimelate epimerase [Myxococcota bacterium]
MRLQFAKYEGLGNDFVLIDAESPSDVVLDGPQMVALCDRHLGVGADGVILTGVREGRPFMRVHNADGSTPEMCGNGIRCVALHLVRTGRVPERQFFIDTDAGPHHCKVVPSEETATVEVRMRPATLVPSEVPVLAEAPVVDAPMEFDGAEVRVTAVSMGNPHAVVFDDVGDRRRALGPRIETDPRFPARANVGFAHLDREGGLTLHVWERGAGWTRACGTGACAAAVAAVETGRIPRGEPIAVKLPGGTLTITVPAPGEPVRMDGPARHVFDGSMTLGGSLP